MTQHNYLFIDRDGTIIVEPADHQIDSIAKLDFLPGVFTALQRLQAANYRLVMVSNQDGLGTASFPQEDFITPHELMLKILRSQSIEFEAIHICPHFSRDNCQCRKPELGLLMDYLTKQSINLRNSYVIGDRQTDLELAERLNIQGLQIGSATAPDWTTIANKILNQPRMANVTRRTNETQINISVDLDTPGKIDVHTGIGFFDHMLEQLFKHAEISGEIAVTGDLHIDDHHTVEDTAIALGEALKLALGDKRGIRRYSFLLPMDEVTATVALDLSGRAYCAFHAEFTADQVGELNTEMVSHFFKSLADSLQATLHVTISAGNNHHMVEAAFKGVARCLGLALRKTNDQLPTTKGIL